MYRDGTAESVRRSMADSRPGGAFDEKQKNGCVSKKPGTKRIVELACAKAHKKTVSRRKLKFSVSLVHRHPLPPQIYEAWTYRLGPYIHPRKYVPCQE